MVKLQTSVVRGVRGKRKNLKLSKFNEKPPNKKAYSIVGYGKAWAAIVSNLHVTHMIFKTKSDSCYEKRMVKSKKIE